MGSPLTLNPENTTLTLGLTRKHNSQTQPRTPTPEFNPRAEPDEKSQPLGLSFSTHKKDNSGEFGTLDGDYQTIDIAKKLFPFPKIHTNSAHKTTNEHVKPTNQKPNPQQMTSNQGLTPRGYQFLLREFRVELSVSKVMLLQTRVNPTPGVQL